MSATDDEAAVEPKATALTTADDDLPNVDVTHINAADEFARDVAEAVQGFLSNSSTRANEHDRDAKVAVESGSSARDDGFAYIYLADLHILSLDVHAVLGRMDADAHVANVSDGHGSQADVSIQVVRDR